MKICNERVEPLIFALSNMMLYQISYSILYRFKQNLLTSHFFFTPHLSGMKRLSSSFPKNNFALAGNAVCFLVEKMEKQANHSQQHQRTALTG